jgi:N-acetylglucosamine kinase-like BadF-type ATPase
MPIDAVGVSLRHGIGDSLDIRCLLVAQLAAAVSELAAAGDVAAARIVADAVTLLLAEPATVVDLALVKRGQ